MRRILVWSFLVIRGVLPSLLRLAWLVVRGATLLAIAGIVSLVRGIPESTQMMADEWSRLMMRWGISPLTTDRLNPVLRVWGFLLIFTGWVVIGLAIGIIIVWIT